MTSSRVTFARGSRRNNLCRSTTTNTTRTTIASRISFFTAATSVPGRSRSLFLFVILLLCIDAPKRALVYMPAGDAIYDRHRGQHGVVLVVVLMHPVTAHPKQVFEPVRPR